ncbi:hypothetical protein L7F22_048091 [Adiantum nelumboides]|nr:hypothetical protein [Adiantum nelumboides]
MAEGSSAGAGPLLGVETPGEGSAAAGSTVGAVGAVGEQGREYRKGNWTLHETVVLIAAKKKDEERRLRGGDKEKTRTAELRWKWIENYCWHNGCHRNQNQCNDKWDNLLRDYKKVRDYEVRLAGASSSAAAAAAALPSPSSSSSQPPPPPPSLSYWQLEKHERKEKGLPSNLLFQVYEALHEVVDKRYPLRTSASATPSAPNNHQPLPPPPLSLPPLLPPPPPQHHLLPQDIFHQPQPSHLLLQHPSLPIPSPGSLPPAKPTISAIPYFPQQTAAMPSSSALPPPPHEFHPSSAAAPAADIYPSDSSDSEASDVGASPAKRRRVGGKETVETSTAELTQALLACEERKDRRHRDLLSVEEKKLMLENTRTQISRDGIAGLIAAINNLAAAVVSLASDKSLGPGD